MCPCAGVPPQEEVKRVTVSRSQRSKRKVVTVVVGLRTCCESGRPLSEPASISPAPPPQRWTSRRPPKRLPSTSPAAAL